MGKEPRLPASSVVWPPSITGFPAPTPTFSDPSGRLGNQPSCGGPQGCLGLPSPVPWNGDCPVEVLPAGEENYPRVKHSQESGGRKLTPGPGRGDTEPQVLRLSCREGQHRTKEDCCMPWWVGKLGLPFHSGDVWSRSLLLCLQGPSRGRERVRCAVRGPLQFASAEHAGCSLWTLTLPLRRKRTGRPSASTQQALLHASSRAWNSWSISFPHFCRDVHAPLRSVTRKQ